MKKIVLTLAFVLAASTAHAGPVCSFAKGVAKVTSKAAVDVAKGVAKVNSASKVLPKIEKAVGKGVEVICEYL